MPDLDSLQLLIEPLGRNNIPLHADLARMRPRLRHVVGKLRKLLLASDRDCRKCRPARAVSGLETAPTQWRPEGILKPDRDGELAADFLYDEEAKTAGEFDLHILVVVDEEDDICGLAAFATKAVSPYTVEPLDPKLIRASASTTPGANQVHNRTPATTPWQAGSRVSLASIVYECKGGDFVETIRENFPTPNMQSRH